MNLFVDGLVVFQCFCIVQGCTTGIWLLLNRRKQPAFFWLGWLVLGLTLQVVDYWLSRTGVYAQHNELYFSPIFVSWGFGPLLYFAVGEWTRNPVKSKGWHLLPMIVQVGFFLFVSLHSLEYKTWFWKTIHKPYTRYAEYYGMCMSVFIYLKLSLNQLTKSQTNFRWIRWFLIGLGSFYVLAVIEPLVNQWYLPPRYPKFHLTELIVPVFTYWLALAGFIRNQLQPPAKLRPAPVISENHLTQIVSIVEHQQLYKDPELTLDTLAQRVGLPANTVSQLINVGLGKSLPDYLNELRVAEVKRCLEQGETERFNLLGIALEAGFRSKTTFNRVFKEQTGQTPKAYVKAYQLTRWDDLPA